MPKASKPPLTLAEKRARKKRRAWIPAIIAAGVIIAIVVVAISLQSAGVFKVYKPNESDSKFGPAGTRQVQGATDAQIDVRGIRSAASLQLPDNTHRTFGPYSLPLEVDLIGKAGTESNFVQTMTVVTTGGVLASVSTKTDAAGFSDIHGAIYGDQDFGFTNAELAAFQNKLPASVDEGTAHFTLVLGTGNELGVPTRVWVTCAGAKGCEVYTTTTLRTK